MNLNRGQGATASLSLVLTTPEAKATALPPQHYAATSDTNPWPASWDQNAQLAEPGQPQPTDQGGGPSRHSTQLSWEDKC